MTDIKEHGNETSTAVGLPVEVDDLYGLMSCGGAAGLTRRLFAQGMMLLKSC